MAFKQEITDYHYVQAVNCVPVQMNGRISIITERIIKEETKNESGELKEPREYQIDRRLSLASYNNTNDIVAYFNYYAYIIQVLVNESYEYHETSVGRIMGLLDAGFVPVFMPPTFFDRKDIEDAIASKLTESGYTLYYEQQSTIKGRLLHNGQRDIWISRMEACDKLGIRYDKFNIIEFIQGVLS